MSKVLFVVLLCIVSASVSRADSKEEVLKQFMAYAQQCQEEVGAAPSDLDDLMKQKPSSTMKGKCMRSCIMEKAQLMDSNGKLVRAVAEENATKLANGNADTLKIAKQILDVCAAIPVPDDHCEAAEAYAKCLKEQAVAHGVENFDN